MINNSARRNNSRYRTYYISTLPSDRESRYLIVRTYLEYATHTATSCWPAMANHAIKRLVQSGLLPALLLIVASSSSTTDAFFFFFAPSSSPPSSSRSSSPHHRVSTPPSSPALLLRGADDDDDGGAVAVADCGCAPSPPASAASFSGSPSALARAIDVASALSSPSSNLVVYRLDGSTMMASDLLGGGGRRRRSSCFRDRSDDPSVRSRSSNIRICGAISSMPA